MPGSKVIQALTGSLLLAATLSFADVRIVYVPNRPPAHVREVIAVRPGPGYVWVPGYWRWSGHHHVWVNGYWIRERHGYHWIPAHWVRAGPRWQFVPGHWAR